MSAREALDGARAKERSGREDQRPNGLATRAYRRTLAQSSSVYDFDPDLLKTLPGYGIDASIG